jgi:hypothetical protein
MKVWKKAVYPLEKMVKKSRARNVRLAATAANP